MLPSYTYRATVLRWVDGDTVDLRVDLGFHLFAESRFRLFGVDTPERGDVGFAEARLFVEDLAPAGSDVVARTFKADKYGRWLAEIFVDEVSVNTALVASGRARPYFP